MSKNILIFLAFSLLLLMLPADVASAADYRAALTKSLLFFEAQRSGKLPANQRVWWRGDSGLSDGSDQRVNLEGGYYDAGDNVKFGFPMAYSITMLAWSVVEFGSHLQAHNELRNALDAIRWGTDYLVRAHTAPNTLYGEVGDADSDHACWQRPEDMKTPRTPYYVDAQHPGADLAGETAAALAAASIAFRTTSPSYSGRLLNHARQLFDFARNHPGIYQNSIPVAGEAYKSSGYQDEVLWAAAWLHRATGEGTYSNYIFNSGSGGIQRELSWDNKYLGAQILIAKEVLHGRLVRPEGTDFKEYKYNAEQFICNCIGKGSNNVPRTNGGLLWFMPWANLQYVNSASFVIAAYADYLSAARTSLFCPGGAVSPSALIYFVESQVNYILGQNPKEMSYMVGYGSNYPQRVHHRGASIVSIKKNPQFVSCKGGYDQWFYRNAANPNVLEGAIVGGPDQGDNYVDARDDYERAEPSTANNAPIVGVLARIA